METVKPQRKAIVARGFQRTLKSRRPCVAFVSPPDQRIQRF